MDLSAANMAAISRDPEKCKSRAGTGESVVVNPWIEGVNPHPEWKTVVTENLIRKVDNLIDDSATAVL
jgi:hypothetical protein